MKIINTSEGINGQLTTFRELVKDSKSIAFIGSAGFCTPFAELMAYVVREKIMDMKFIPGIRLADTRSVITTPLGMQLGEAVDFHADTVVLFGGLAMPKICEDAAKVNEIIAKVQEGAENKLVIGICFQSIFKKQGWTKVIDFNSIINSDIFNEAQQY